MNNTAIIIGTYNRGHLLERSLKAYPQDVDIYIMDDDSADNTCEVAYASKKNINYWFLTPQKDKVWRDSASYLNKGIQQALKLNYQYIFITHPEIIPGATTIQSAIELSTDKETWISAKGYYLTPEQQALIDTVDDVRKLPNFYGVGRSAEFRGNPDYLPENIEKIDVWHSWIFGGGSADMWRYFGGLTPFDHWGSVDVDLNDRRRIAGMKTVTPGKQTDIVIHQNHDDLGTPRDMEKCMSSLHVYDTKQSCLKPELLL